MSETVTVGERREHEHEFQHLLEETVLHLSHVAEIYSEHMHEIASGGALTQARNLFRDTFTEFSNFQNRALDFMERNGLMDQASLQHNREYLDVWPR